MKKILKIEREFNAPIEKIWNAFTIAEELLKWWSPAGMTASNISVDLKKDGKFHFCFNGENNSAFWALGVYEKITSPTYLSYYDSFSDPDGNPVSPSYYGMEGDDIAIVLVEISFTELPGKTLMSLTMKKEYEDEMLKNMTSGWNSMFDKLVAII